MESKRIDGTVAVVAGGSSGVGLAAAKTLAELGARVVVLSRRTEGANRAANEVREASGSDAVESATVDMIRAGSIDRLREDLTERFTAVDVLVSAAGSIGETGLARGRSSRTNSATQCSSTPCCL